MDRERLWTGEFEFNIGSSSPVETEVALTPDKTVHFLLKVDSLWRRDITHQTPIFGIHFDNETAGGQSFVVLNFRQVDNGSGELVGEWSMSVLGDPDGVEPIKYKKLTTFTDFDAVYDFKLGYENGKFFINLIEENFTRQVSEQTHEPGTPVRFQHPEQPHTSIGKKWGVNISLLNG